jgi:hypothetical protein
MSEKVELEIDVAATQARTEIRGLSTEMKGLAQEGQALAPSMNEVKSIFANLDSSLQNDAQMAKVFGQSLEGLQNRQSLIKNAAKELIDQGLKPESKEIQDLKIQYEAASVGLKEFEKNQKGSGTEAQSLSEKLTDLAKSGAALAALNKIKDFGANAVQAYGEAEAAATRLDTALALNHMEGARAGLDDLAQSMQNLTGTDGDLITQMEAELVAQGKSEAQIQKLIKAAAGLSAATGDDLSTSVQKLNATYAGVEGQMGKLIPDLKDLSDEQLKAGAGVDLILEKYSAFIGKSGNTEIALKRAKESVGDLNEAIGQGLSPIVNEGAIVISGLAEALANVSPTIKTLGAIMIAVATGAMVGFVLATIALTAAKWGLFGAVLSVKIAEAANNPIMWAGIAAALAAVTATGLLVASKQREANALKESADATRDDTAAKRENAQAT